MKDQSESGGWVVQASRLELFKILHFLENDLPNSSAIHYFVNSAIITRSSLYQVSYVKDTKTQSYTAIVGLKREKECSLVLAWDGCDPEMLNMLNDTHQLIDWNKEAVRTFGYHSLKEKVFLKHLESQSIELIADEGSPISQYYLPIKEASTTELMIPNEVYVRSLEAEHAPTVHQACPYRSSTALEDLKEEIRCLPSAGVFLKENNELVAWIMSHPPAGMSRLHTIEPYRRKGYASIAVSYMSKIVAQTGCVPFVNIIKGNTPAIVLFANLGFRLLTHRDVYVMPGKRGSTCEDAEL